MNFLTCFNFTNIQCINTFSLVMIVLIVMIVSEPLLAGLPTFDGKSDVGKITLAGSVQFDSTTKTIRMTGSGENIWGNQDAFFFLWKKINGDVSCKTDIAWIGVGKNAHRKAGWMIRAGLNADDAYVDAVVHGDGLISMQYRSIKGGATSEVQLSIKEPMTLHFEKTGDQFTLCVIDKNGLAHPVGTITVELTGTPIAGLVVCSHDSTVSETAIFSNILFESSAVIPYDKRIVESTLETINIETGVRTIIRRAKEHFEAPNWSRDGKYFVYNSGGKIYTVPANGSEPKVVNTDFATTCNNDHGISWNGKNLVISHHAEDHKSIIYLLPIAGGKPRRVTQNGPSYWHGWSPDDKTLAYCAERNGKYDVYTISVNGGKEKQLTNSPGLDDGPEYSPDGKYIYFNSVRTGQMKIWRMNADGSNQKQFTPTDDFGDWFAHPSPDNKQIVFVSYDKSVEGHPANKNVVIRIMPTTGGAIKIIAQLFGGQGTMNVHSWSPDSKQFAFVSYRLVAP